MLRNYSEQINNKSKRKFFSPYCKNISFLEPLEKNWNQTYYLGRTRCIRNLKSSSSPPSKMYPFYQVGNHFLRSYRNTCQVSQNVRLLYDKYFRYSKTSGSNKDKIIIYISLIYISLSCWKKALTHFTVTIGKLSNPSTIVVSLTFVLLKVVRTTFNENIWKYLNPYCLSQISKMNFVVKF